MSAVIPPKRSRPLTPAMKLAAGDGGSPIPTGSSSARPPPPALRLSSPSVLCPAVTALQRPTLKLASLSLPGSFASLSLAIPAGSDAADVRSDVDSDDEDAPRWREGDQKRMAGELLKVIRGGDGLEDDLSGRHRILVRRSPSRENPESVGGTSMSRSTSTDDTHLVLPVEHSPDQPVAEDDVLDEELEVNPGNLRDLGKLGEGASGEVRKVQHTPSGMIMAKKTISTSPNPSLHKQHLRELAFMRECSNPFIVQYYGAFLEDNDTQIGICMEYCEAGSLETIYKRIKVMNGRTGEKVLGKIAESVLMGLVYLHDRKIIHRDIKPSNVLVTREGVVKVCDFGVSGELINSFAGTFVGTTFYLAPERIRGSQYTITSDVWSAALTVLEVALNRFPFPAQGEAPLNGPIELLTYLSEMDSPVKVLLEDEADAGQPVKYTKAFKDFVGVCLDKDPTTRPSPKKLLTHGWIRRSMERMPQPDLRRWMRTIWGWSEST